MKRTFVTILLGLVMIAMLAVALSAQTLPVDSRKKEMQFHRSYECLRYATPADTVWHRITLPDKTVEVQILPGTGAIGVRSDSLYTNKSYVDIPAGTALKFPVMKADRIYVRRTAVGTASVANILFLKM